MDNHVHPNQKKVINRMSRIIGHMESIKRMVEEGRDCTDVLIQISAVRAALNNAGKVLLSDHINHCVKDAIEKEDIEVLDKLNNAIDKFVK